MKKYLLLFLAMMVISCAKGRHESFETKQYTMATKNTETGVVQVETTEFPVAFSGASAIQLCADFPGQCTWESKEYQIFKIQNFDLIFTGGDSEKGLGYMYLRTGFQLDEDMGIINLAGKKIGSYNMETGELTISDAVAMADTTVNLSRVATSSPSFTPDQIIKTQESKTLSTEIQTQEGKTLTSYKN